MKILTATALVFAISLPATATVSPSNYSYSVGHVNQSVISAMTYSTEFSTNSAFALHISQEAQDSLSLASISSGRHQCWVNADYTCGISEQGK